MPKLAQSVIVSYTSDLRFYGIYTSQQHAASHVFPDLTIEYGAQLISKYLNYRIEDCNGFIFLKFNVEGKPIKTHDIRVESKERAEQRKKVGDIMQHISRKAIMDLSSNEIDMLHDRLVT